MVRDRSAGYHIHSTYNDHSDSDVTIKNVIDFAERRGLRKIAFTEAVRRTSDWFAKYLNEIELYAGDSRLEIIPGFEAKILSDGNIDCPDEYRGKYFLSASFHNVFGEKERWISALESAISVDVIGHLQSP